MQVKHYKGKKIRNFLDLSPYEWRATATYGVERFIGEESSKILMVYVKESELSLWKKYLSQNSIHLTNILPDLKLIGVKELPRSYPKDEHLVNIDKLVSDLYSVAPRYQESHPEIIKKLRNVA